MKIYDELPDKRIIYRINVRFYEKVYADPWLSKVFKNTKQDHITNQQTHFITAALGGPNNYSGRMVSNAHPHIFISENMFEHRAQLLHEAFVEMHAPAILIEKWTKIDASFKNVLVKKDRLDCVGRFKTDEILYFPN